jgi:CubicO group peptidase (beta-lactamase class C family)
MKKYLPFIFAFISLSRLIAQESESLKKVIEQELANGNLTGAVWSIVSNGEIQSNASGLKNTDTGEKLSSDDHVHIGSVTKTLLATGVLQLVSQNKLNLDTPVEEILPNIQFDNPWRATNPVCVRHLLNHTSGLEDARFWQVFSEKSKVDTPLEFNFKKNTSVLTIRTRPGSRFSYSNMGFTMMGLVIESITDETYETYLDTHLLKAIGMHQSTFQFRSQKGDSIDGKLAMGHFENNITQETIPMYLRPAGQFTTSAYDMGLFAQFLMSDGSVDGKSIVNQELLNQMGKPIETEANRAGLHSGYRFGLSRRDRHNAIGYTHSGNTIGYRAVFYLFPEEQKAFFLSINTDSETANYEHFTQLMINALDLNDVSVDEPSEIIPHNISDWEGYYILSPRRFEMFDYIDYMFAAATVKWSGEQLIINPIQSKKIQLTPVNGYKFKGADRIKESHILYKSESASIISDGLKTYEKTNSFSLIALWLSLALGLLGLLFILLKGFALLIQKKFLFVRHSLFIPFLSVLSLSLPIPLFFNQSFLALGDYTIASFSLALVTGFLPIAITLGLINVFRNIRTQSYSKLDTFILFSVLQWTLVLLSWGMIPFRLWV